MLKNYFKTSFRNLLRHKGYSFINIFGLTVGLATSIFIFLWVIDELSYDKFHKNGDRAYRVLRNITFSDGKIATRLSQPEPLAAALHEEIPEIEYTLRLSLGENLLVRSGDKAFFEKGFYGDSTIFKIFTFPVTKGDASNPIPDIKSIAISEKLAAKYFGTQDPIGKTLQVDQRFDFTVSAVFADVPKNSDLQFDYVIPFEIWKQNNPWAARWGNTGMQMFASLKPDADMEAVNVKIEGIIKKHCDECPSTVFLFPYTDLRLYAKFENGKSVGGRIDYVMSFSTVAIVILIIACINFMNLATARAATRSREVGVRKAIGAQRTGLITQFIGESLMLSFIALAFALMVVQMLLPYFNEIADKSIHLDLTDPQLITGLAAITLLSGLMAGSYPAFFLSSFKPVSVLKGSAQSMFSGGGLRKTLVVVQFAASVILIIGSVVVYNQVSYIQNTNLGFDKENVIVLKKFGGAAKNQETYKTELLQHPSIKNVGIANQNPFNVQHNTQEPTWPGKPDGAQISFKVIPCDQDFIPTMKMKIIEGRNFTNLNSQDTANVMINEQAMKVMGFTRENIIGTSITMSDKSGRVIGLVEDFNNLNLHEDIAPLIFTYDPNSWTIFVRVEGDLQESLAHMKKIHQKFDPEYPFDYAVMEDLYNKEYRSEEVMSKLALSFTVVAILISCLGLFGLASFTAERRMKELGIRKVMGASAINLIIMLCSDFTKLVTVGLVIACPIAWYLASDYLSGYAYHTELNVWVFIITALAILFIALMTVIYQSARAATTNPVNSLRNE